jgi:hypothetical protein
LRERRECRRKKTAAVAAVAAVAGPLRWVAVTVPRPERERARAARSRQEECQEGKGALLRKAALLPDPKPVAKTSSTRAMVASR